MSTMAKRMRGLCRSPREQVIANLEQVLRVLPLVQIDNTDHTSAASLKLIDRTVREALWELNGVPHGDASFALETCRSYLPVAYNLADRIPLGESSFIPHPMITLKAELSNAMMYSDAGLYFN